jgi:hypothetical protein
MFDLKSEKKVEIRPIDVKKWHGKKGNESFKRPIKLQALASAETMTYATGLTEEDIELLRKKVNYDLTDIYLPDTPHPFWDSNIAILKLPDHKIYLQIKHPLNYIKYRMAVASKYIANSMREFEEGKWPEATHVIHDETDNEDILASKEQMFEDAIIEASKLTKDKKVELVQILGGKNMKGQSDNAVKVKLAEVIKADPETFLMQVRKDPAENTTYALVLEALQVGVLRKDGHKIMYMDSMLGNDELEVVSYLCLDENQEMKLILQKKITTA